MRKFIPSLMLFYFCFHCVSAQVQSVTYNDFYATIEIPKDDLAHQHFNLTTPITSIAIEFPQNQSFEKVFLIAEGETFALSKDIHTDLNTSNLIVFSQPIRQFEISNQGQHRLKLHLLYAPPLPKEEKVWENKAYRVEEPCEKSNVITGAQWRMGLPAPKEAPVATQVRHVIVHHASGSNSATNYTEVVRNIFLLHTQTNGWNDIGYNYLIAQDGTVFEGRLGQGRLESDNVLGAHFCGKNTNTMGICLLGDYQTANPPQPMLNSLYKMIAWKLSKENLTNVFASFLHPQGTSSATMLGVISGHRDGCATDCPGDNVYRQLMQIKTQVSTACSNVLASDETRLDEMLKIYPQPATDEVFITTDRAIDAIVLQDITGKEVMNSSFFSIQNTQKVSLKNLKSGIYILKIVQNGKVMTKKLVVER